MFWTWVFYLAVDPGGFQTTVPDVSICFFSVIQILVQRWFTAVLPIGKTMEPIRALYPGVEDTEHRFLVGRNNHETMNTMSD